MAWKGDSRRHSLARKGIKTANKPMKSMGRNKMHKYLYHGTGEGSFRRIRIEGFTNDKNYFTETQEYAQSYADRKGTGERILRIKPTEDTYEDERTGGGDFIVPRTINPEEIEVLVEGKWMNIQDYHDESRNILPIKRNGRDN